MKHFNKKKDNDPLGNFPVLLLAFLVISGFMMWITINHWGSFSRFCMDQGYDGGFSSFDYDFSKTINACNEKKELCRYGTCETIQTKVYPNQTKYNDWKAWVTRHND